MEEKPIEIPGSRWEWLLADKRRLTALIVGTLALLGVVAALAVGALSGEPSAEGDGPATIDPVPPAGSVDATNGAGSSTEETPGVDGAPGGVPAAGGEKGGGSAVGGAQPVVPGRAPYIAYRYDGQVWVSHEDGSGAIMVADSPQGTFSLSPDGTALALVDGGLLSLITVADRARTEVGVAEPDALAWEADSSAVLCVRASDDGYGVTEVWRVPRRVGATPIKLVRGRSPSSAVDGTVAALPTRSVAPDPAKGTVWVLPSGRSPRQVTTSGHPAACAVQDGTVAYAVTGMRYTDATGAERQVDPEIRVMNTDGSSARRIVGKPATQRPFGYANLLLSPDGQRLLYAEVGDDGYSRAWIVPVAGGAPIGLSLRRDTYPLGWSADGTSVFFIEGNAFQGEPTALMTARSDGLGRRTVIEGAGL